MAKNELVRIKIGEKEVFGKIVQKIYYSKARVTIKSNKKEYEYDIERRFISTSIPSIVKDKVPVIIFVDPEQIQQINDRLYELKL